MKRLTSFFTVLMLSMCIAASPAAFAKKTYSSSKSYGSSYSNSKPKTSSYDLNKNAKVDSYYKSESKKKPVSEGSKYGKKDLSSSYKTVSGTKSMEESKKAYKEVIKNKEDQSGKLTQQYKVEQKGKPESKYGSGGVVGVDPRSGSTSSAANMMKSKSAYASATGSDSKSKTSNETREGSVGHSKDKYSDEMRREVKDSNYKISKERPVFTNSSNSGSSSLLDYAMGAYIASSILSSDDASAKTNAEIESLKKEIEKMNMEISKRKSLTPEELAKLPKYTVCSGRWDQSYYAVAQALKSSSEGIINLEVLETKGSVDNLEKIKSNQCDFAIIQGDVVDENSLQSISLIKYPYSDTSLLVCSKKSKIKKISDVKNEHKLSLPQVGSGGYFTWNNIEKMFGVTPIKTSSSNASIASQMNDVKSGRADCMFTVGKTTSKAFVNANETMKMEDEHLLVDIVADKKTLSGTIYSNGSVEENKLFNVKNKATVAGFELWDRSALSLMVPNGIFVSNNVLAKDPSLMIKLSEAWGF